MGSLYSVVEGIRVSAGVGKRVFVDGTSVEEGISVDTGIYVEGGVFTGSAEVVALRYGVFERLTGAVSLRYGGWRALV
jgi:hypothetical protein